MVGNIEVYGYAGSKGTIPCSRSLLVKNGGLFPAIVSFKDGEVFTFYRGTPDHVSIDSNIAMKSSKDLGETWSDDKIITEPNEGDARNPAVGVLEPSTIVVLYTTRWTNDPVKFVPSSWEVKYRISKDRGKTWSEHRPVQNPKGYTLCSPGGGNNLTRMVDGLIGNVFGLVGEQCYYQQPKDEWVGFPMYFDLFTERWDPTLEPIIPAGDEIDYFMTDVGWGAMIRGGGIRHHGSYVSYFDPTNNEWSKPIMAFPDGMGPTRITKLPGGILLASIGRRKYPYGAQAMLSYNSGRTWDWETQIMLADNCGVGEKRGDNGYTSSTFLYDGSILSVWYKNLAENPYFPGTGNIYTLEMAKYRWDDVLAMAK